MDENSENQLFFIKVNIFCLLMGGGIAAIHGIYYWVAQFGYISIVKAVSLLVIFILAPSLLGAKFSIGKSNLYVESQYTIIFFILSVIFGFFCGIYEFNIGLVSIALAVVTVSSYVYKFYRILYLKRLSWLWLLFLATSFSAIISCQYHIFDTPTSALLLLQIIKTTSHWGDSVFLGSISSMLKTYNVPSAGMEGVAYLHYHWGAMWFLAMLSNLVHVSVVKSYEMVYPVFFLPLLIKSFLLFCRAIIVSMFEKMNISVNALLIIIIAILVIIPLYPMSFFLWQSEINSQSYALALCLSFLLISLFVAVCFGAANGNIGNNTQLWVVVLEIPLLLFFAEISKISLFYDLFLVYFYLFIRLGWYKQKIYWGSIVFSLIGGLIIFYFCFKDGNGGFVIRPFDFIFKPALNSPGYWYKIFVAYFLHFFLFYFWVWLFLLARFLYFNMLHRQVTKNYNHVSVLYTGMGDLGLIIFLLLINGIPGYLLKIGGGSAYYFLDITRWVSVALFLAVLIGIIYHYSGYNRERSEFEKNFLSIE